MPVAPLPSRALTTQGRPTMAVQPGGFPRICVKRIVTGTYDLINDGINPTLVGLSFRLVDIPGYTEFTAMFQTYCIEKIRVWFRPEYTELTDASALSNAVNVEFVSAIDTTNNTAPTAITDVQQYQQVAHTGITETHFRVIRPAIMMNGISPMCALVSTASPSTLWYGLKVAIAPCGVAMTFRSTVEFTVALTQLK